MVRRFIVLAVIMALTVGLISGCEEWRNSLRPASNGLASKTAPDGKTSADAVETDPTKIQAVDADSKNPKAFFQPNRRSGGWSSEAREIESHLGVAP